MPIFALETSSERLSLAIIDDGKVIAREIDAGQRHSELAVNAIAELFAEAKLAVADMDVIAFGQGPGSFVGVRIACGLAQGLALGAAKKVLPVQTQMALAEQAFRAGPSLSLSANEGDKVLVAIDARMNEIYLAAYQRDEAVSSGWRSLIAPMLGKPQALPELTGASLNWIGIGSAFDSPILNTALAARYPFIEKMISHALPRASDVATIALRQWVRAKNNGGVGAESQASAGVDATAAAPLYLRNRVAQTIEERLHAAARMAAMDALGDQAAHEKIKENTPMVAS